MNELKHIGTGPRGGCLMVPIGFAFFTLCIILIGAWANSFASRPAQAKLHMAMELPRQPKFEDRVMEYKGPAQGGELRSFGTYGDAYYLRRWKKMCKTGARYDAMREAYDLGKGNPC